MMDSAIKNIAADDVIPSSDHPDHPSSSDDRQCWICLCTVADDPMASWLHPCKCRGTTQWVHSQCLHRWIDEKQQGNILTKVSCERCRMDYIVIYPRPDVLSRALEICEAAAAKTSPVLVGLFLSGTLAWCAMTYGALTVFVCLGHRIGLRLMQRTDPSVLLLTLPIIPISLVSFTSIKWGDDTVGLLAHLTLDNQEGALERRISVQRQRRRRVAVVLCEAFALPIFARAIGHFLFSRDTVPSQLCRTLLGGVVYFACRNLAVVYLRYTQLARQSKRDVLSFTGDESRADLPGTNNPPPDSTNQNRAATPNSTNQDRAATPDSTNQNRAATPDSTNQNQVALLDSTNGNRAVPPDSINQNRATPLDSTNQNSAAPPSLIDR